MAPGRRDSNVVARDSGKEMSRGRGRYRESRDRGGTYVHGRGRYRGGRGRGGGGRGIALALEAPAVEIRPPGSPSSFSSVPNYHGSM